MKHNEHNLNKIIKKPLKSKRNRSNLLYKNYIYNLFQYNESKYKKINNEPNFKAIIKSGDTQTIPNNTKKYNRLYTFTNENNKNSDVSPSVYKTLNNNISIQNKNKKKKFFKSRNNTYHKNLLTNNYSSLNKLMTISGINSTITNSKEKNLFLRPTSKQRLKTEITQTIRENKYTECNKLNKDKLFKNRLISSTYRKNSESIKEKHISGINRPISSIKKNKIKMILFRDFNDMKPRNRFNLLRRDLLEEDLKINKMIIKFQTQIAKNQLLVKRFQKLNNKGNS
jgi:hypothetical protein